MSSSEEQRSRTNMGLLLPFFLAGLTNQEPDRRVIFVNPSTQTMYVLSTDENDSFFEKKGHPPASKASIEALPVVEIDKEKEQECPVCLEECEKGVEMPCKHVFHKGCVEKWLSIHGSCPVCRFQMPVEEKTVNNGDDQGGERRETWVWLTVGERRRTDQQSDDDDE